MKNYGTRTIRLIFGLFLYALGSYLSIQANIGLAPWEAFSMGLSYLTKISYGNIVVLSGLVIIVFDFFLKEKIGFGTIVNAILIGKFVDLLQYIDVMPMLSNFWLGLVTLLLGQVVISIGSFFYISACFGCGPRDALMVALGKRLPKVPIGGIRGMIETVVLVIGWMLGAKVGIGTVIAIFGISFILQGTFQLFHFEVKEVAHESIHMTIGKIFGAKEKA